MASKKRSSIPYIKNTQKFLNKTGVDTTYVDHHIYAVFDILYFTYFINPNTNENLWKAAQPIMVAIINTCDYLTGKPLLWAEDKNSGFGARVASVDLENKKTANKQLALATNLPTFSINKSIIIVRPILGQDPKDIDLPNILFNRVEENTTFLFENRVATQSLINLIYLFRKAITDINVSGQEILIKNNKNKILFTELEIFNILDSLEELLPIVLEQVENSFKEAGEDTHDPVRTEKIVQSERKTRKEIKALMTRIKALDPDAFYGAKKPEKTPFWMTKNTEYDPTKIVEFEEINSKSHVYSNYQSGPRHIIVANVIDKKSAFHLDNDRLLSIVRATLIDHFLRDIAPFILAEFKKLIHYSYSRVNASKRLDYVAQSFIKILLALRTPGSDIEKAFSDAIANNQTLIDTGTRSGKESASLFKFLKKISMPIDIDNTNSSQEKKVAARLRELGRLLSTKHGIPYNSDPGEAVLDAVRKADDVDDIMLDVTTAVEDCFDLINSAPPTGP
jgi:hypothetical protein